MICSFKDDCRTIYELLEILSEAWRATAISEKSPSEAVLETSIRYTTVPRACSWFLQLRACSGLSQRKLHTYYCSRLNPTEIWFARIERDVIARGVFTSLPDLASKLRRYINAYSSQ